MQPVAGKVGRTPPEIFNPEILLAVYISFNTTLAIQV
tara:strand:- start:69 stop:179 length:111 start_codon:yes stop_codon:yes gene_type:complete